MRISRVTCPSSISLVSGPPPLPQHFLNSTVYQSSELERKKNRKSKRKKKKPPLLPQTAAVIPAAASRSEPRINQSQTEKLNTLINPFVSGSWPLRNCVSLIPETSKIGNRFLERSQRLESGTLNVIDKYF